MQSIKKCHLIIYMSSEGLAVKGLTIPQMKIDRLSSAGQPMLKP